MTNRFTDKHRLVLEKTLKKYGNPDGIQNIYELEGFLVGALCCPERVDIDDMMFVIFGPEEETYPEWSSESEIEIFFDSLFGLQNKNNSLLRGALYKPKLLKDKKDHKKWCRGFLKGFGQEGFEAAEQFYDDEGIQGLILFVCGMSGIDFSELSPDSTEEDANKISLVMEEVTTKMLAQGVQYLFLNMGDTEHEHCCDGEHDHHHHDAILH
jgi:yecA family protein